MKWRSLGHRKLQFPLDIPEDLSVSSWIVSLGLRGEGRQETDESLWMVFKVTRLDKIMWGAGEDRHLLKRQEGDERMSPSGGLASRRVTGTSSSSASNPEWPWGALARVTAVV